jgi:hypothetical protein
MADFEIFTSDEGQLIVMTPENARSVLVGKTLSEGQHIARHSGYYLSVASINGVSQMSRAMYDVTRLHVKVQTDFDFQAYMESQPPHGCVNGLDVIKDHPVYITDICNWG